MATRWLFPIELYGLGTEDVECLSSYLIRAGIALGVTPGQLLSHTKDKYITLVDPENNCDIFNIDLHNYYRPNKSTELLVKSLDEGTGLAGFRRGTFLALGDSLDRSQGAFSNSIRWCPLCFDEFERLGDKAYFKLIWQVKAVTHCHIHATPLVEKCPHCDKPQSSLRYRSRCIECVHCKKPMTHLHLRFGPNPTAVAKFADIRILVKEIASHADLIFPKGGVRSLLEALFNEFWSQEDDLKMWKKIPRDTYLTIIDGTKPITFETARSIAFRLGLSLPELLKGKLAHTNHALDPSWTENIPQEFKPIRHKTLHDPAVLEAGLRKALTVPESECKPLKQVAHDIGVSEGCLRNRFPSACEQIIKRNEHRSLTEEMKLRMKVRAAVTGHLATCQSDSDTPDGIVTTIYRQTGLPRERIRKAVQEFQQFVQPSGKAPAKPTRKTKAVESQATL